MRTRKRRKSWSPNATPEVCRHHDHQLTVSNTFEKLSCQRANLDNSSSDYHYCHHQHYCHYHAIDNHTKCNNLNKHCNAKSTKATRPFRKPVNLPDSFITLLYLSTCFLLFYNEATNQRNPFHPLPIQPVTCQRLSKTLPFQTQQQSQASKPFLPKPQTSSHHNSKTTTIEIVAQQGGIIKDKNVTLTRDLNPIVITKDIIIKKDAKLTIESGAELLFERKKGIIVYGTLDILGSPNNRVKLNLLKSQQSATVNYRSHTNNLQQVRLVDGDLPSEGRVQIKFNDRWHSLCTNSKNLTAADIKVICQQVGYQDGYWYKWFPRRNDTTLQIMSKSFHCVGTEAALNQCQRWNRLRAGGGVCDNQSDIGIRCARTLVFGSQPGSSYDYWKGIEFVNGETNHEYVLEGQMKQRVSKSSLTHLSISDAGQNQAGNATAAIRVYGQPPKINNIEIKNSIYGIMIEDTEDAFGISNVKISNNLGYPLFINTSWGKVSLDNIHVENNGGDGIRIVRHEKILVGPHDFCRFANLGSSQSFPVILSHEQTFFTSGRDCCQEFVSNNQLTAHFPVLRSTPNNLLPEGDNNRRISIPPGVNIGKDADLVIYDDYQDEYPFRISVRNSTRAQSIVSRSGRLKICYKPATYRTVLFTVVVVADVDDEWSGTARDVEISNSFIKNNGGRGIWIDNQRSGVKLMNTTVLNHNYLSGVHVENGTGEVIIQGCNISHNLGHGLLINLAGGYYHVDNSTISDNLLKGIAIEYDKRPELVPFNHTMHLGFSLIARNGENGIFIGNVCRSDAFWNISMNSFIGNGEDAIQFQSCLPNPETVMNFKQLSSRLNLSDPDLAFHNNFQELTISHNIFLSNIRRAIRIAPVFFVKAFIRHNTFKDHQLAVLYVSNQKSTENDPDFSMQSTTNIRIASNRFYSNLGRYVANIGVQEDNPKHSLIFTKNTLENNVITEPYNDLRPRSRVSAVVVVSSSNTKVIRNRFNNPQSSFDLGSHLEMHYKIINATTNFWGRGLDAASIYRRIFDRKNRYNLAQIEFLQYLLSPEDLEYATDLSFDRERDKITTFKNGSRLGGEVKGYEDLPSETYIVQDDIFVRPGAHLILRPGTVLKFHDGVGVMVQGRLDAIGQTSSQIIFTSMMSLNRTPQRASATTTPIPKSNTWVSHQPPEDGREEEYEPSSQYRSSRPSPSDRSLAIKKRQASNLNAQSVRLSHTTMGRLEVQMEGVWGSVCDYNFDIDDAAVACQQLGMVLNREDWLLERFQYASNDRQQYSMMSTNVLMTNLRCDPTLDTDLTKCKAEVSMKGDFDGICNSEVGIKCFPPSWSGIRIGMGAEISTLNHIVVQRAGMFDYASYQLKPALQIDFNRHLISAINVKSNGDSGLGILWNDVIGRHFSELSLSDSKFLNNERHGIELKTRGLTIKSCLISNNRQHGLDYNPSFSQQQLTELLSWLHTYKNSENIVTLSPPLESRYISVPSSEDSYRIFVFQKNPQPDLNETFTISTDLGHMLSLQLLNPIHPESTETLNMSLGTNPESPVWDLRVNATSLPMVSPGYKFHFNYSTGRKPKGNIVLYIRSRFNNRILKQLNKFIPAYLISNKFEQTATNINTKLINTIVITNSNITRNGLGLKFRQPNQPTDNQFSYNLRYANETTNITNNLFDENRFSSIFVNSDDYNFHVESANTTVPSSEITYNLLGNKIRRNMDGIRQFNRDIRQSYNVFHWTINDTSLDYNRNGGINIVLPYFWKYDTNLSHTIEISNNTFWRNSNFDFSIGGHFAMLNLTENMFKDNKCKSHLIAFRGMEKRMLLRRNVIEQNFCGRIIEVNIASHADKMGLIPAVFEYNSIRYNRRLPTNVTMSASSTGSRHPRLKHLHPHETDYVLSLKGIQPLNITRNLFLNPDLRFELIAGIASDPEEPTINAMENYWGSALQAEIDERIFDFDDWNDYSIANISPYLTQDSFASASVKSERKEFSFININRPLGGRLTRSLTIPYRREPYLVVSDLTVMPDIRLTIERGTTLEFMPNVGILVLGELIAAGTRERPILMRPALSAQDIMPLYQYLFPPRVKPSILHMDANDPLSYENNFRSYQSAFPIDLGSIRLCKNEICNDGFHIYENNVEDQTLRQEVLRSSNNTWKLDGFLEIFNMTTLQWIPICDPLFTEHSARVVCRQLGYSHLSIYKRGRRYTIEQEQISSIKNWPDSLQCDGDETILSSCSMVPRSSSTNHTTTCTREGNQFIYVYCADLPDPLNINSTQTHSITTENVEHWGGLRFSGPSVSMGVNIYDSRDSYNMISQAQGRTQSILQYINVKGAGILHMKRSAAVQVFQSNVRIEYTSITESAHHGLEYVTSQGDQNFHQLRIRNNHGVGFNHLSLTGSSSTNRVSPYLPLKHLDVSPETYGMINICGSKKEIQVEERILLFYKYSSQASDCIRIISSKLPIKHIGIRLLQFDLFNSTPYTVKPDSIRIYDGDIFDRESRLLADLSVTERHRLERPELKFYQTSDSAMTVRLHASGASSLYGFIAEVVTTPVSYNIQRDSYNNLTYSDITNNRLGALTISAAGESSPNLIVKNNRFESNCLHLFGNFTSCISPIYMELQNCQKLRLINNLIRANQGGAVIKSYSHSAVSALEAAIENNVFESNQNNNILALLGPKTDPYQSVRVMQNFFTGNMAQYVSDILLSRIVANFSYNIVSSNIGKHQIEVLGFDKLPLSHQKFYNNWIYNNTATMERDKSTIIGNSAGQQYRDNYLVNPDNHFEISTMNWSRYDTKPLHTIKDDETIHLTSGDGSTKDIFRKAADAIPLDIVDTKKLDLFHATIDALQNWWGFNSTPAIQGRIRDNIQHGELLKVDFVPYLATNRTVLSGICAGGWQRVGDICLVYVGARMNYQEAKEFCDREGASLLLLRGNHYELSDFIRTKEREFDPKVDRIWIRSFDVSREACPALNDFRTKNYDCLDRNSFLCEKDPLVIVNLLHWHRETGGLVALILAMVTLILTFCCTLCWVYKSRQMQKEKIRRRKNSVLYSSMRSNRGPYSSSNSISEQFLHRQLYNTENSSITDLSLSTQFTQPSDSAHLVRLDPGYTASQTNPLNAMEEVPYANSRALPFYSPQPPNNPTYVSPTPTKERIAKQSLPSVSPNYDSPPIRKPIVSPTVILPNHSNNLKIIREQFDSKPPLPLPPPQPFNYDHMSPIPEEQFSVPVTPAPSYREVHPKAFSNGSRTPSYSGSQAGDISTDPMPLISTAYSQINHMLNSKRDFQSPIYDFKTTQQYSPLPPDPVSSNTENRMRDIDDSDSTAPTYYNNQLLENYEESSQSYLESEIEAYNRALQRLNNDTTSIIITERSSTTDIYSSQLTRTSIIDSQTDLVSMRPQSSSEHVDNELRGAHSNRAYSDTASGSQRNRYYAETSLDEEPTMAPTSMFGSSQRLSPVSSSDGQQDSKQGSRVFLETSFG